MLMYVYCVHTNQNSRSSIFNSELYTPAIINQKSCIIIIYLTISSPYVGKINPSQREREQERERKANNTCVAVAAYKTKPDDSPATRTIISKFSHQCSGRSLLAANHWRV